MPTTSQTPLDAEMQFDGGGHRVVLIQNDGKSDGHVIRPSYVAIG
jgi:hypothetical protein